MQVFCKFTHANLQSNFKVAHVAPYGISAILVNFGRVSDGGSLVQERRVFIFSHKNVRHLKTYIKYIRGARYALSFFPPKLLVFFIDNFCANEQ